MSTTITAVFITSQSTVRSTTLNSLLPGAASLRSRRLSRRVPGTLGRFGRLSVTGSSVAGGAAKVTHDTEASVRMATRRQIRFGTDEFMRLDGLALSHERKRRACLMSRIPENVLSTF